MTDTTTAIADTDHEGHDHSHGLDDKGYVKIALWLAVITGAEVAWSYFPFWEDASGLVSFAEIAGLLIMMAVKFVVVAGFFMHLRFDNKLLTRLFYAGLFLAVIVYMIALSTFEFFSS
jgi:cytochrome c oxidase subunit 4